MHRHYLGFATSQLRELKMSEQKTVKRVLYVLRTTLTGVHALLTGEIVADITELLDVYGFTDIRQLIERKRAGERASLPSDEVERLSATLTRAFTALEDAAASTVLPDEPRGVDELESWLIDLRKRAF